MKQVFFFSDGSQGCRGVAGAAVPGGWTTFGRGWSTATSRRRRRGSSARCTARREAGQWASLMYPLLLFIIWELLIVSTLSARTALFYSLIWFDLIGLMLYLAEISDQMICNFVYHFCSSGYEKLRILDCSTLSARTALFYSLIWFDLVALMLYLAEISDQMICKFCLSMIC